MFATEEECSIGVVFEKTESSFISLLICYWMDWEISVSFIGKELLTDR